jgi:hypothetical protein
MTRDLDAYGAQLCGLACVLMSDAQAISVDLAVSGRCIRLGSAAGGAGLLLRAW